MQNEGKATQRQPVLRIDLICTHKTWTLLLMPRCLVWLSYYRSHPHHSKTDTDTADHWTEQGYTNGRIRRKTEGVEGDCVSIERVTISTNLLPHFW